MLFWLSKFWYSPLQTSIVSEDFSSAVLAVSFFLFDWYWDFFSTNVIFSSTKTKRPFSTFSTVPFLFPKDEDLLSQDYQTAAESGEDIYARFGGVYPVMKVSLGNNMGDGPSVNQMVDASNKFTEIMDARTAARIKKNFSRFMAK